MRLPGWLRGRSRGDTADRRGLVRPPESAPAAAAPEPPDPGWQAVPAIQRTVEDSAMDAAHLGSFGHSLASHQDPRFLEPLGHHVTPEAPAGRVDGVATPRATTLPAPPRSAAPLVQRMTFGDPPPDGGQSATPAPPLEIVSWSSVASRAPVTATGRQGPPVAETPPVQRTAATDVEVTAGGASRGPESVPRRPALSTGEPAAPPPAPTPAPTGAGLLGDEPLTVGSGLDVGSPVQRTAPETPTIPAPGRSNESRPPVTVSRLVQPPSTTGTMPAPPVRPVPTVAADRAPTPSHLPPVVARTPVTSDVAVGPDVSRGRPAGAEAPPDPEPTTGPQATVGLVGDQDHLLDAAESSPEVSPSALPEAVPAGQAAAPAVQRLAEPTARTGLPAPTLHWPPASSPEHASVAVLPRPPLVPAVGTAGRNVGEPERSARADVGYGVPADAGPRVQRAAFLLPDVPRPEVSATGGHSSQVFAAPMIASAAPPGEPLEATAPAVTPEATMPPARVTAAPTAALQRSAAPPRPVSPPRPVAAPRLAPAAVPLTPLPSPHRGALPPPVTPLAPAVSDGPFVSRSSPGAAPLVLQRHAGAGASPLGSGALRRPVAGPPTEAVRASGTSPTSWTEVVLPEAPATFATAPSGPRAVAAAGVQRQSDDASLPSPDAERPVAGEPEAPAAAAVASDVASPAAPSGSAATPGAKAAELDELARRLYEPLTARLRAELWLDRERTGRSMTR